MNTIYIIEDDGALRRELECLLECRGFSVISSNGQGEPGSIASNVNDAQPDCVILDLMLPTSNGHDVCREIRNIADIPIIMLTASTREVDEVLGLGIGADDYVTKPYSPAALIARIDAVLRRHNAPNTLLTYNGVVLDGSAATVKHGDKSTELTRNELRILTMLMETPGKVVSRIELMQHLWETDEFVDDNTLTVNVNRLRKKLSSIGVDDFIQTRRNLGYAI